MTDADRRPLLGGFWVTSLGILASRVLGLLRDMATAALLGLGGGGVMDAFVVAFRIPNLFRRLFGEGALAASYLPLVTEKLEHDRRAAWQLASVMMTWLVVGLTLLVAAGEGLLGLAWIFQRDNEQVRLLVQLSAAMLPYLVLICLAAQLSATLQALSHFSVPALAPTLVNICWLAGAWGIAPHIAPDKLARAYLLTGCVLVSGVLQVAVQVPMLRRFGFRFDYDWAASRDAMLKIGRSMAPMLLGLAVTQINTLSDSVLAWLLAADSTSQRTIAWLGGAVEYPLKSGAAAALYYGERFYQFPVGILGVAIATVIFPRLSRHAARGDRALIGADLTTGLKIVWFTTLPAGLGLILLAEPLARLIFERGEFTAGDAARAARVISCFSGGVWAYCAAPVVARGFYALGDFRTPVKVGLWAVALNILLDLSLVWYLAEAGLAVATAISAHVQTGLLMVVFSRRHVPLAWRELARSTLKTTLAALVMSSAVFGLLTAIPASGVRATEWLRVGLAVGVGIGAFCTVARMLGMEEIGLLIKAEGGRRKAESGGPGA